MDRSYWRTVSLITLWQVSASICYYTVFAATPFFRDAFELSLGLVGLAAGILLVAGVCLVASGLVVAVIRSDPPVGETAMAE